MVDGHAAPDELSEMLEKGIWLRRPPQRQGVKTGVQPDPHRQAGRATRASWRSRTAKGRNRQVRRMLAGVGHKVRDLTRINRDR